MRAGRLMLVSRLKERLSFASVVSLLAVFVALGGSAYAAGFCGGQQRRHAAVEGRLGDERQGQGRHAQGRRLRQESAARPARTALRARPGLRARRPSWICRSSHTKGQSDARYLRGGLVIGRRIQHHHRREHRLGATATCPAGYQATSGGADSSSVGNVFITSSEPVIENSNVVSLSDGLHGAPTAWRAFAFATVTMNHTFKVVVICAPVG